MTIVNATFKASDKKSEQESRLDFLVALNQGLLNTFMQQYDRHFNGFSVLIDDINTKDDLERLQHSATRRSGTFLSMLYFFLPTFLDENKTLYQENIGKFSDNDFNEFRKHIIEQLECAKDKHVNSYLNKVDQSQTEEARTFHTDDIYNAIQLPVFIFNNFVLRFQNKNIKRFLFTHFRTSFILLYTDYNDFILWNTPPLLNEQSVEYKQARTSYCLFEKTDHQRPSIMRRFYHTVRYGLSLPPKSAQHRSRLIRKFL
jgi:hypothetical protein